MLINLLIASCYFVISISIYNIAIITIKETLR